MKNQRKFKSQQTKSQNLFKQLKIDFDILHLQRFTLLQDLNFFYSKQEYCELGKLSIKQLHDAKALIMFKLLNLDKKIAEIYAKMDENRIKAVNSFLEFIETK